MSLANKIAPIALAPLSDGLFTQVQFLWKQGRLPNLKDPQTFNEKLQWLKLNYLDPLQEQCADKYAVREYVANRIGKEYLIRMLGLYRSETEIDFDILPEQFVLKGTHGSGQVIVCQDKSKLNTIEARNKSGKWLRTNFYRVGRERVYKNIQPGIIAEEFMEGQDGNPPIDYKIFCFHGEPKYIEMDFDRFAQFTKAFYDTNWNLLNMELEKPAYHSPPVDPPDELHELIEIAKQLSIPFPFVRVDLYAVSGKVYFGELTFYPGKGVLRFRPEEFDCAFGRELDLKRVSTSLS